MSLLSTIAHEGAPPARRPSVMVVVMTTALVLALATVGIGISQWVTAEPPGSAPAVQGRLTGEEFLRLNTSDLPEVVSPDRTGPASGPR
jgi:hypothetical protein